MLRLLLTVFLVYIGLMADAQARTSKIACGNGYRNVGKPMPAWWAAVQKLAAAHQGRFPPGMSLPFIGAWIERESSGKHNVISRLGEVGYFQLHPEEIVEMVGKERAAAVAREIRSSPTASMVWGGHYLTRYDAKITALGAKRGTETYYGLLKAMHWNPVHTPRWIRHVKHALGKLPTRYNDFIVAANKVKIGMLPRAPGVTLPANLPSCSAFYVLDRAPTFGEFPPKTRSLIGVAAVSIVVAGLVGAALSQLGAGRFVAWQGFDTADDS